MLESAAYAVGCTVFPGGVGQTEQQVHAIADLAPSGYTGTPSFLKIILEKADQMGVPLPSLKRALFSGEAFPPSLCKWFSERGIDGYQAYGSADLGMMAYETSARVMAMRMKRASGANTTRLKNQSHIRRSAKRKRDREGKE